MTTVNVDSLGNFEDEQERNLFFFEQAYQNLQDAYTAISAADLSFKAIDSKYLTRTMEPTVEEISNIIETLFSNKTVYRDLINQMLEDLNYMSYDDALAFLDSLLDSSREIDEEKLAKAYEKDEKSFLEALLTFSLSGQKEVTRLLVALVKWKSKTTGQYLGIAADLAQGNTKSLVTLLFKNLFNEQSDDVLNSLAEGELSSSVSLRSIAVKNLAIGMAFAYAVVSEGAGLIDRSQTNKLTFEDWAWAVGNVAFATGSAYLAALIAAPGGVYFVAATAVGIALSLIFKSIKDLIQGNYEIGNTGVPRNGVIFSDDILAQLTGEKDNQKTTFMIVDNEGNCIDVDLETAFAILVEDWEDYIHIDEITDTDRIAIDKFLRAVARADITRDEFMEAYMILEDEIGSERANKFYSQLYDSFTPNVLGFPD